MLLPAMPPEGNEEEWEDMCRETYPEFQMDSTHSNLNDAIADFNLNLQERFKLNGHGELYMMDETS